MKKSFAITGGVFLLVYIGIAAGVCIDPQWLNTLDRAFIDVIQSQITAPVTTIVALVTDVGKVQVTAALTILLAVWMLFKKMYIASVWLSGTMLIGTVALTLAMKLFIDRDRPDFLVLAAGDTPSFPSGHTVAATLFYGGIGLCLILIAKHLSQKLLIAIITSLMITFVMGSRIYLGAHFPTDVIGGLCFGLASIFISISLYQLAFTRLQALLLKWKLYDRSPNLIEVRNRAS